MLRNGDVIFINTIDSLLDESILKVETGYKGNRYNHVGIYYNGFVIEATPSGVLKSTLETFFKNSNESVLIGRVYSLGEEAAKEAYKYIGFPYNASFVMNNKSFYCSELIHHVFEVVNNKAYFKKHPLRFEDEKNKLSDFWIKYYNNLNMEIPVNEKGSNPSNLSNSDKFYEKKLIMFEDIINLK